MPTQGNQKLTVRMDGVKRQEFIAEAYNAGTTGSRLVLDFIDWWMGEPGAELPARPARVGSNATEEERRA